MYISIYTTISDLITIWKRLLDIRPNLQLRGILVKNNNFKFTALKFLKKILSGTLRISIFKDLMAYFVNSRQFIIYLKFLVKPKLLRMEYCLVPDNDSLFQKDD